MIERAQRFGRHRGLESVKFVDDRPERRLDDLIFALEVVLERAIGVPGLCGEAAHRGSAKPAFNNESPRNRDDLLSTRIMIDDLWHVNSPPGG